MKKLSYAKVFLSVLFITQLSFAQDATEIIKKADELIKSKSSYAEVSMTIIKTDWTRTIGIKSWALEPDYALMYITEPARDKGTVTLKRKKGHLSEFPPRAAAVAQGMRARLMA